MLLCTTELWPRCLVMHFVLIDELSVNTPLRNFVDVLSRLYFEILGLGLCLLFDYHPFPIWLISKALHFLQNPHHMITKAVAYIYTLLTLYRI